MPTLVDVLQEILRAGYSVEFIGNPREREFGIHLSKDARHIERLFDAREIHASRDHGSVGSTWERFMANTIEDMREELVHAMAATS